MVKEGEIRMSYTDHLNAHTYQREGFYTASSTHITEVNFYGQIWKISINKKVLDNVINRSQAKQKQRGEKKGWIK